MACSACSKRNSGQGRVVPINPNSRPAERTGNNRMANGGNKLRKILRFTGR